MAERLGLYGRYYQHETTQATIMLAETATNQGIPVSMLARDVCRREVSGSWDNRVLSNKTHPYRHWVRTLNNVIWTSVPSLGEVQLAKQLGVRTSILINWETLVPEDEAVINHIDKVILPYRCVGKAIHKYWTLPSKPIMMPWDVPVALTKQPEHFRRHVTAYFPLYDSQPERSDCAVFDMMEKALSEVPDSCVLIACGRKWSLASRKAVKRLRSLYGPRTVAVIRPNMLQRLLLFARADVTVWAPRFESFGIVGLNSICMGTPVLSWDVRPQNEFLKPWKNAMLVPCKTDKNWIGVPEVVGGYGDFGECLIALLRDKALLARMKSTVLTGMESRKQQFLAGWEELLK